jgi:uncharacterized phiE125 gp8 family phage protein
VYEVTDRWSLEVVTPPTQEPVSLDMLALHCRIDDDVKAVEANTLTIYLAAARERVERMVGWQLATATYRLYLDDFPGGSFHFPLRPIQSVTSIQYYVQGATVPTNLDLSIVDFDLKSTPSRMELKYGTYWPMIAPTRPSAVVIEFVAGLADLTKLPNTLKLAILFIAADYWKHREESTDLNLRPVPNGVRHLIYANRTGELP